MSYTLDSKQRYRMPTHFGPAPGPRNVPAGNVIDHSAYPLTTAVSVRFPTEASHLEALMPEGFSLSGEPIVSFDFGYMKQIPWLAGRGYSICLVSWPCSYRGRTDSASGRFASVLFENAADPIITGRDELGHPKIYCEIPDPVVVEDRWTSVLSWVGCEFVRVAVDKLEAAPANEQTTRTGGWLQLKYIPGTPPEQGPDCAYVTHSPDPLDPDAHASMTVNSRRHGRAEFHAASATWQQLPTLYHVANALAALPVTGEVVGTVANITGWMGDVGDTRRLD